MCNAILLHHRQFRIVIKLRRHVQFVVWQRYPQLGGMHVGFVCGCDFGVGYAIACGHQIHLFGLYQLVDGAYAVAVQHGAFYHPSEGLQTNVRMGAHIQTIALIEGHRACMVKKAPCAYHALLLAG